MPEHFNRLTPAEAERLAILAEECAEVIHVIGKILRHGYASFHPNGGPDNRVLLEKEVGDVNAIISMMFHAGDMHAQAVHHHAALKTANIKQYLHHQ